MRQLTFKTALALGIGLTALAGGSAVLAQDAPAPANGPGPATQPPPAPGTTQPAPTQPAAPPTPPGTATAPDAPAPASPAAPPPNYKLQYNGLIDGYYLFNFHNPKDVSQGAGEPFYDTRHNSPALSLAELNVFANAAPGSFGYKATFMTGDTADINHGGIGVGSLGEARFKNIQQLYGTYSFNAAGAGVDVGKFYTPFGYEVTESNGNYNYSRSTAYNLLPFYHAGARVYSPLGVAGLTGTLYLVNGIFNTATLGVQNDSKRPGYIGQLNYTDPKGKFTFITEVGAGSQKFSSADTTETKVLLNDNNFTYNINANQLVGLDYEYGRNSVNGGGSTTSNGYAVYYRQAVTAKTAFALRYSGYNQKVEDGMGGTSNARPYDITATYEIKAAPNFLTRLEYRHDHINYDGGNNPAVSAGFYGGDSLPNQSNQDTLSLSGVFTFAQ